MRKLIASLALAAGALVVAAPASADIIVRFTPATSHIGIGDTTSVKMEISGLGDEILSAFDVNLLFNQTVLDSFAVSHDAVPQFGGAANSYFGATFGAGNTGVIDGSLMGDDDLLGQANEFVVLTFDFRGLANGFSVLNLGLDPDFERNFVGLRFQTLNVQVIGACISVGDGICRQEVPEPSILSLLGLALAGAGLIGFRRRRTA